MRRHEALGLLWADVSLVENMLRVRKSKSTAGERAIAIPPKLAEELWQHRRRSDFQGDDERVFPSPTGASWRSDDFTHLLKAAIETAGVENAAGLRPFHDLRHASLTLGALAGEGEIALMARAGHASMATTKRYLDLAGRIFPEEAERLERRLLGPELSTKLSTNLSESQTISPDVNRVTMPSGDRGDPYL